jgi:hypothetical protein
MKRLIAVFVALVGAQVALAATIGLEWSNLPGAPRNPPAPWPGYVTMRLYIQNGSSSAVQAPITGAIGLVMNAWEDQACTIPANNAVAQVSSSVSIPGWSVASANNNTTLNGLQFAAAFGPDYTVPQGKNYLLDITIKWIDSTPLPQYYLTIDRAASAIIDPVGADYMTNDAIWYDSGFQNTGKSKWGFGNWDGGRWERYDSITGQYVGQAANPLIYYVFPEPGSLTLFIAGAFCVMRRRQVIGVRFRVV